MIELLVPILTTVGWLKVHRRMLVMHLRRVLGSELVQISLIRSIRNSLMDTILWSRIRSLVRTILWSLMANILWSLMANILWSSKLAEGTILRSAMRGERSITELLGHGITKRFEALMLY